MKNKGLWITSPCKTDGKVVDFRKNFSISKPIKMATLYATAMGIYVPIINGVRAGNNVFAPGWTSYNKRIQVQQYDITNLIKEQNTINLSVGNGWAVGNLGFNGAKNYFSDKTSVLAWIDIEFEDGDSDCVFTDTRWEVYSNEVVYADIYNGETVDKTLSAERIGNCVLSDVKTQLIMQEGEDVVEHEKIAPVKFFITKNGEKVIDFGQNMTGYVEVRIKGNRGEKIVIHHAETLDKDGNFYTANYRSAKNEITYILSGNEDVFKPKFSFQGFRYIQLVEYPESKIDLDNFTAIVVYSRIERTCDFVCGNEKINQLYHNIVWGQKGNFLDVPTDCPQRDERMGWTGDAQVFCKTAAINFDVEKFFKKWLNDMAVEQNENGGIYCVVPMCMKELTSRISSGYGDAACIIPWEIYLAYGNIKTLRNNYPMMKKWVDYIHSVGGDKYLWLKGEHFGDWLAMDAGIYLCDGATSPNLIASAFFAHSTKLLIKAGRELGEDVSYYETLYENIKKAFREYFMKDGLPIPYNEEPGAVITENPGRKNITQTALSLILCFDLCEKEERSVVIKKLVELIDEFSGRMVTGFIGTRYILHALSQNGYTDVAYKLLYQEKYPSWLYSVKHGATTIWEHFDGIKDDGSFWLESMNSFNHYAYGSVFDWIFGVACGIKPIEPAYKTISVEPHPDKGLGFVKTHLKTRNGLIKLQWYYKGEEVCYEFEIPVGMTAYLKLPSGYARKLSGGHYLFQE